MKDWLHNQEVHSWSNSCNAQLKPKHHVELLPLEPVDSVGVEGHVEWLSSNTKDKPWEIHQPQTVKKSSNTKEYLAYKDDGGEQYCPKPHTKHTADMNGHIKGIESAVIQPVNEEATNNRKDHIRPGVPGVQTGKLGGGDAQASLDLQ